MKHVDTTGKSRVGQFQWMLDMESMLFVCSTPATVDKRLENLFRHFPNFVLWMQRHLQKMSFYDSSVTDMTLIYGPQSSDVPLKYSLAWDCSLIQLHEICVMSCRTLGIPNHNAAFFLVRLGIYLL